MKFFILITLFIFSLHQLAAQNNARLSGKITNPNGEKVFLFKRVVVNNRINKEPLDSTLLKEDGSFELSTNVDKPSEIVFFDGKEQFVMVLAPEDDMQLTLNTSYFDETIQFTGQGSEKNNALKNLYLINEGYSKDIQNLIQEDEIDTIVLYDFMEKSGAAFLELIEDYKNELPEIEKGTEPLELLEARRMESLKKYVRQKIAFEESMKLLLNKKAIDFAGVDLNGDKVSLSDFKGKVTVVDFWATWCVPCKAEFPAYKELEDKYGEDVNFVSVGVYCKEDDWRKMATQEGFEHNIFISKEKQDQISMYKVNTIPRYLVIDENFKLIDADAPRPSSGKLQKYWE
jgi:thiol-disulfide isomerase/thioredoxin